MAPPRRNSSTEGSNETSCLVVSETETVHAGRCGHLHLAALEVRIASCGALPPEEVDATNSCHQTTHSTGGERNLPPLRTIIWDALESKT